MYLLFKLITPAIVHPLAQLVLLRVVLTMPQPFVGKGIGQILLRYEVAGVIMGVFISIMIAKVFHQLGWCIAQMQRHWLVAGAPYKL